MPSQVASSDVETSITRVFSVGRCESDAAIASSAATPVALSLAPGTASRRPMSAIVSAVPAANTVPSFISVRLPTAAPAATAAGPKITGHISPGLVSVRSSTCGNLRKIISGIAGW